MEFQGHHLPLPVPLSFLLLAPNAATFILIGSKQFWSQPSSTFYSYAVFFI